MQSRGNIPGNSYRYAENLMHRRLPHWALIGGALLSAIAGIINVVGYMGFRHEAVTHLTGTVTLLGIALTESNGTESLHWAMVIGSFVMGAILSGFMIGDRVLKLGRPYGLVLAIESILLFAAIPLLRSDNALGLYFASMACGLQNGMASSYSGAVLRTTHVSGSLTDIGIALGLMMRGKTADHVRLRLCIILTSGFFAGCISGGMLYPHWREVTLIVPAALTGLVAITYHFSAYQRNTPHA
jgi:uncharacterized membrane protein YoaK (UPF0700 family)